MEFPTGNDCVKIRVGRFYLIISSMQSPDEKPDGVLIERALAGDKSSFNVLAVRYRPALLRGARSRLGRIELAEEAVQETLLNSWRWLKSYNSKYSFRTWLWTILFNACNRILSKQSRKPGVASWTDHNADAERQPPAPTCGHASPGEALAAKEQSQLLAELLATLPQPEADALRMRFFGGLQFQEIADAMNSSLSGAKRRVKNGLLRITDQLRSLVDEEK